MNYHIQYQILTTNNPAWYSLEESYPSEGEAMSAIHALLALGGRWGDRAYRVRPIRVTALSHPELVRFAQRLRNHGADLAFLSLIHI